MSELSMVWVDRRFDEVRYPGGKQSRSCAKQKLPKLGLPVVISTHHEVCNASSQPSVCRVFTCIRQVLSPRFPCKHLILLPMTFAIFFPGATPAQIVWLDAVEVII